MRWGGPLPAFDPSREPLGGSVMLAAHGPWLAVGYQGGTTPNPPR